MIDFKKMEQVKTGAHDFAAQIIKDFGTDNVFSIAEGSGVRIVYEKWFPVTWGEFDKSKKTIFVNLNAGANHDKIIAHELGHFFARDLNLTSADEEIFAHAFAEYLTAKKV